MEIDNLSRFAAAFLPTYSRHGEDLQVVCVAARYDFPAVFGAEPQPAEQQPDPILDDRYWGEAGVSSLWMEGQGVPERPGADVYVSGHAWAPNGEAVTQLPVAVRVGPHVQQIMVFGDRVWEQAMTGPRVSAPRPFVSMALRYERAFGGEAETRNPIGCGRYSSARQAVDQPLPNIEDPRAPITRVSDWPGPVGLSPVLRQWSGRVEYGGTYDSAWADTRAPFWPKDFDARFFNAAAPGLVLPHPLRGREAVVLDGLSVAGRVAFHLPAPKLLLKSEFGGYEELELLEADALHIEPDAQAFTLYYRAAIARGHGQHEYIASVLREVHEWEDIGI